MASGRHRGRAYGYTISQAMTAEGETWNASCACGWFRYGQTSRRAAELALKQHSSADGLHRKPCLIGRDAA